MYKACTSEIFLRQLRNDDEVALTMCITDHHMCNFESRIQSEYGFKLFFKAFRTWRCGILNCQKTAAPSPDFWIYYFKGQLMLSELSKNNMPKVVIWLFGHYRTKIFSSLWEFVLYLRSLDVQFRGKQRQTRVRQVSKTLIKKKRHFQK